MLSHTETAPDFDDPLGLLRACHGRVTHFAELALRLADHPSDSAATEAVQQAAGKVLRYFDQAAPLHHADEEEDLLPRLRQRLDDGQASGKLAGLLAGLADEHGELHSRWQALRPFLVELQQGRPVAADAFREAAEAFHAAEMDHVNRENTHLLPAAEAHLTAADREALGRAMAHRRGVRQNRPD